jgi:hypothetical protein
MGRTSGREVYRNPWMRVGEDVIELIRATGGSAMRRRCLAG